MSMCQGLDGRIWIGSENTQPGDGTGGVQVWDPSKPPLEAFTQFLSPESAAKLNATQSSVLSPQHSVQGGLGDDNCYAIACDLQGRIWAGHLRSGVSVYNGERWQTYEVIGGLSRPDTLNGPLGERIFHITVCPKLDDSITFKDPLTDQVSPMSGSVWMCTSAGLSIYFPSTDTWSYLTRADGLPSDQANSLAFDPADGTVYLATQCDGIAIASAKDQYKTWKNVRGPDELPTTPAGDGLPNNLMNDIIVANEGTVYAATTAGLAWSSDHGAHWEHRRGNDYAAKASVPPAAAVTLSEDYTTALAFNAEGHLILAHRTAAGGSFHPGDRAQERAWDADFVTALLPVAPALLRAGYASGVSADRPFSVTRTPLHLPIVDLPRAAAPPTPEALVLRMEQTHPLLQPKFRFLAQDWSTQGDWVGRYGRHTGLLCAASPPLNHTVSLEYDTKIRVTLGTDIQDTVRAWLRSSASPQSLWNPKLNRRVQAEWDDHGEAYPATLNGPDLHLRITLPTTAGHSASDLYRISLYFVNVNRAGASDKNRDFLVELSSAANVAPLGPPPARARITHFYKGVYAQFLVPGTADILIKINRNYSLNAICSGVFIDRLQGPSSVHDRMARADMGNLYYQAPEIPKIGPNLLTPKLTTALEGWSKIENDIPSGSTQNSGAGIAGTRDFAILAYRAAQSARAPAPLLARWRWAIPIWTIGDRALWTKTMQDAWQGNLKMNPHLQVTSPNTVPKEK